MTNHTNMKYTFSLFWSGFFVGLPLGMFINFALITHFWTL